MFMWIPAAIINCIYVDDSSLTWVFGSLFIDVMRALITFAVSCSIEKVLVDHIIPANKDPTDRCNRLLLVLQTLDERAIKAFEALMQRQKV